MGVVFNVSFTAAEPRKNATEFQRAKWYEERAFYNLTAPYNYHTYTLNGKKVTKNKDILSYMQKSTGAFNLEGEYTSRQLSEIKKDLAQSKSIIWHGFMSFDKDTSNSFQTQQQCQEYLKRTLGALFDNSHINLKNIALLASLHEDTAHRHIHFSFWEKEPMRIKDSKKVFTQKGMFSQKCIDNFMVSSGLYFDKNKHDLHTARDKALARLKELMPGRNKKVQSILVADKLQSLAKKLPSSGRLQYNSKNAKDLRGEVNDIVAFVARSDKQFGELYKNAYAAIAARRKVAQDIALENKTLWIKDKRFTPGEMTKQQAQEKFKLFGTDGNEFECIEKLQRDFDSRFGQLVINGAKRLNDNTPKAVPRKNNKSCHSARIVARQTRQVCKRAVGSLINYMNSISVDYTWQLHQVENEIAREQSRRYV